MTIINTSLLDCYIQHDNLIVSTFIYRESFFIYNNYDLLSLITFQQFAYPLVSFGLIPLRSAVSFG